jgi:hypothetical protein
MTKPMHDPTRAGGNDSPFADVEHPRRRLFLEALAHLGTKAAAAEAVGIGPWTCYSRAWKRDQAFQRGLEIAEAVAADRAEREIWRRGVEGIRRYRHSSKTGEPLAHPDLCDRCERPRKEHVQRGEGEWGPHPEVECPGFAPAPYYELEFSDATLLRLLQAYRPERYADRLNVSAAIAKLDLTQLPDTAIARIAAGEPAAAVLASILESGPAEEVEAVRRALPPDAAARGGFRADDLDPEADL